MMNLKLQNATQRRCIVEFTYFYPNIKHYNKIIPNYSEAFSTV